MDSTQLRSPKKLLILPLINKEEITSFGNHIMYTYRCIEAKLYNKRNEKHLRERVNTYYRKARRKVLREKVK